MKASGQFQLPRSIVLFKNSASVIEERRKKLEVHLRPPPHLLIRFGCYGIVIPQSGC
jgi:hypothetical protein